jgi:hypothetical protein
VSATREAEIARAINLEALAADLRHIAGAAAWCGVPAVAEQLAPAAVALEMAALGARRGEPVAP